MESEKTGQQRDELGADECDAAARHELYYPSIEIATFCWFLRFI